MTLLIQELLWLLKKPATFFKGVQHFWNMSGAFRSLLASQIVNTNIPSLSVRSSSHHLRNITSKMSTMAIFKLPNIQNEPNVGFPTAESLQASKVVNLGPETLWQRLRRPGGFICCHRGLSEKSTLGHPTGHRRQISTLEEKPMLKGMPV